MQEVTLHAKVGMARDLGSGKVGRKSGSQGTAIQAETTEYGVRDASPGFTITILEDLDELLINIDRGHGSLLGSAAIGRFSSSHFRLHGPSCYADHHNEAYSSYMSKSLLCRLTAKGG